MKRTLSRLCLPWTFVFVSLAAPQTKRTVVIEEIQSADAKQAQLVRDTVGFWLKRSEDLRVVGAGGDIVLSGSVAPSRPRQVAIVIGAKRVSLTEKIEGSDSDVGFLAKQLANRIHFRLTQKWLPEIASSERFTPRDTLIVAASDPIQQIEPPAPSGSTQPKVKASLNVDRGAGSTYTFGETVKIGFKVDRECFVTIYNVDSAGNVTLLFPNPYSTNNRVVANKEYNIPGDTEPWDIEVGGDEGLERVTLIATLTPWNFPGREDSAKAISVVSKGIDLFAKSLQVKLRADKIDSYTTASVRFYSVKKRGQE